ncbi:hypothetical protein M9H77_30056 [Catharanthus roseus]|uniref:Uncharacterized protein n=1 Tax=Catharanthus roseus TaxID=4058 RepID=A0ACB9ZWH7_CATRO|nr:hypothetical protein M9H77_30056 [Catharanthus roseus]
MGLGGIQEEAGGGTVEPVAGAWWPGAWQAHQWFLLITFIFGNSFMFAAGEEDGRGLRTVGTVCPTASTEWTVGRYTIRPVLSDANTERLHVESGSPILTDEQLMFEVFGDSNNSHVYDFNSQSAAVTMDHQGSSSSSSSVPSISFVTTHKACTERESRLWRNMQHVYEKFISFVTLYYISSKKEKKLLLLLSNILYL